MSKLYFSTLAAILFLSSSVIAQTISSDCTSAIAPAGYTRIYIGNPVLGGSQSGTSASDPLDGSTPQKFDTILRSISEGQNPSFGALQSIPSMNLIVCIGSGDFKTDGQYDASVTSRSTTSTGFTVGTNWKIHGQGSDRTLPQHTTLVLDATTPMLNGPFTALDGCVISSGNTNTVIGTNSVTASGIEISDLTIDANHDALQDRDTLQARDTQQNSPQVLENLIGIMLRSSPANHWIHNVTVIHASGDVTEQFPVWIYGDGNEYSPSVNTGNLIENVYVTDPGRPPSRPNCTDKPALGAGGFITAITVNNAIAEVRNNYVSGYGIGYGGWSMGPVWFHDNIAENTVYGFNIDSLTNSGVVIQSNQITNPQNYGIVVGDEFASYEFSNFKILKNTITSNTSNTEGIIFQGLVQNSWVGGNVITTPDPLNERHPQISGISIDNKLGGNGGNAYQFNQFANALPVQFDISNSTSQNCLFQNFNASNQPISGFADNSSSVCVIHSEHIFFLDDGKRSHYPDTAPHVRELQWEPWRWWLYDPSAQSLPSAPPTAKPGSALTSFSDTYGEHVFHLDANNHVVQLYWNGTGWTATDLTALTNSNPAVAGSALSSFGDLVPGFGLVARVSYIGTNQHVYQLWWSTQTFTWQNSDLTAVTGAPAAASGSPLNGFALDIPSFGHEVNVVYLGADQHIYMLWWSTNDWAWHAQDLTTTTGAPVAAAGSALTSLADSVPSFGLVQRTVYLGADQHVYQLWWSNNNWLWQAQDMTATTGAPLAVAGSALASATQDISGFGHEVYFYYLCGNPQHLCQLWWGTNNWLWQGQDLTQMTSGTVVSPGSSITAYTDFTSGVGNVLVVAYIGTDGHVDSFWWSTRDWTWHNQDVTALTGNTLPEAGTALSSFAQ